MTDWCKMPSDQARWARQGYLSRRIKNYGTYPTHIRDRYTGMIRTTVRSSSLRGADLSGVNLDCADLEDASLDGANLGYARLDGASLVGASLVGAWLIGARLDGAWLDRARLDGAWLDRAKLDGANLTGTVIDPEAEVPELTDKEIKRAGLDVAGDLVYGWRTDRSIHSRCMQTYEPGRCYKAPWFSISRTSCHPGIYIAGRDWLRRYYPDYEYVRCFCRRDELVHAGDKWRCKRLWVCRGVASDD